MINKIQLTEVNDIKVSVVQFEDYLWMGEPSYEVAIIDADDVKDIGRYFTEAEAIAKAEEIVAQATIETVEATIEPPVVTVEELAKIFEAYDIDMAILESRQREVMDSMVGTFSKTIEEYVLKQYGSFYDDSIYYQWMEEYLSLTMYKQNIYNKEFNKFFSYWMPKPII